MIIVKWWIKYADVIKVKIKIKIIPRHMMLELPHGIKNEKRLFVCVCVCVCVCVEIEKSLKRSFCDCVLQLQLYLVAWWELERRGNRSRGDWEVHRSEQTIWCPSQVHSHSMVMLFFNLGCVWFNKNAFLSVKSFQGKLFSRKGKCIQAVWLP